MMTLTWAEHAGVDSAQGGASGGNNATYTISPFTADQRGMFHSSGQNLEIETIPPFSDGYAVTKFKNVDSNGNQGNDSSGTWCDTDIPLIRLAEIYLNYAEAVLRGGGGDLNTAAARINELRERAYGNSSGNITSSDLSLQFVLDERSKELYWEGQRRSDLIRHNKFVTSDYMWPFKAGAAQGKASDDYRRIFPIPEAVLLVNTNLTQNPNY